MVQYPSGLIINIDYNYITIIIYFYKKCYEGLIFFELVWVSCDYDFAK